MADNKTDYIKDMQKRISLDEYKDASETELRNTIDAYCKIGMSIGNSYQDVLKGAKALGVVEACQEILENRKQVTQRNLDWEKRILEDWEKTLDERRYKAFLNLKYASTPNGQLIIHILLYDNGKTRDELATWCDELEMIDDAEFDNLLSELVKEGVIEYNEEKKKYFFKRQVTRSLFPESNCMVNPLFVRLFEIELDWKLYNTKTEIARIHAKILLISEALRYAHNPVTAKEILELIDEYCNDEAAIRNSYRKYGIDIYKEARLKLPTPEDVEKTIHFFKYENEKYFKTFGRYKYDVEKLFYFTMVGEKEGE